jgi:hypothetical protein
MTTAPMPPTIVAGSQTSPASTIIDQPSAHKTSSMVTR